MTNTEFRDRHRRFERCLNRFLNTWGILFFAFLLGNIPIAKHIDQQTAVVRLTYGVVMFGLLAGLIIVPLWYVPRLRRRFGVFCPHCDKPLVGSTAQIAIATGNCGNCGSALFTDGSQPS